MRLKDADDELEPARATFSAKEVDANVTTEVKMSQCRAPEYCRL